MRPTTPGVGEEGFVLIAAIWLLILAGSITAILMLRSLAGATAAAEHQDSIERQLAQDSAIETMLADRLFNGNRSAWWSTPASGEIAIGKRRISIHLSSESGRLDVNAADPAQIDKALQGLGVSSNERSRIVGRLTALRVAKRTIASLPELLALIGEAGSKDGVCLAEELTWVSGLSSPRGDQVTSRLARALGAPGDASGESAPSPPEPGTALRVRTSEAGGPARIAIVRTSGLPDQPTSVSVWGAAAPCPPTVTSRS